MKREKPIPERKLNDVKELSCLAKEKTTLLIASTKNLPDSQFQDIKKKLREIAIVKVPKKSITLRSLKGIVEENYLKEIEGNLNEGCALVFSDLGPYELAGELLKSKSPAKAKAGQEAPEDIEIQEGPTDLVPGPAISELGNLGIPIQIENGKIHIKQAKVIVKKGEKISQAASEIMNKLDIKPFSVGFIPLLGFDLKEQKLYTEIKIDSEQALKDLKYAYGRALPFAVEIGYVNSDTIGFLISKAGAHEKALEKLESSEEKTSEEKTEEKENVKEKTKENKEEPKENLKENKEEEK